MRTNDAGLALIKAAEGLRLKAYQDSVGVWTIGYGHTGKDVHVNQVITEGEAEELLRADLREAEEAVSELVKVALTPNQFSALVSFTFNLGAGALSGSTLLRLLNSGDYKGAAGQFLRWTHAGGKVLKGLVVRRTDERALFLKD